MYIRSLFIKRITIMLEWLRGLAVFLGIIKTSLWIGDFIKSHYVGFMSTVSTGVGVTSIIDHLPLADVIIKVIVSLVGLSILHRLWLTSNKPNEFPETYIEFALETQKTNNHTQFSLASKANIQNFTFKDIVQDAQGDAFGLMLETIAPIDGYILDIEALNTKLRLAISVIFSARHTIFVKIAGDLDKDGGKYKFLAKKTSSYEKKNCNEK